MPQRQQTLEALQTRVGELEERVGLGASAREGPGERATGPRVSAG